MHLYMDGYMCINIKYIKSFGFCVFSVSFSTVRFKPNKSGPEVIKLFSCSTQLSTKIQLLIKTKIRQIMKFLALSLSDVVLIMHINVKMPTNVGILIFISRITFVLS